MLVSGQIAWGVGVSAPAETLSRAIEFYFNPDDMKPLINSEGHLRALENYVKFLANSSELVLINKGD